MIEQNNIGIAKPWGGTSEETRFKTLPVGPFAFICFGDHRDKVLPLDGTMPESTASVLNTDERQKGN